MSNTENEAGRSMIEMLGVLAIIGVLSVGGIAGYSKAMQRYRINKTIEQVTLIAGNIRSYFRGKNSQVGCRCGESGCYVDYSSEVKGCPIIKKAKIIPDEMLTVDSDGKITAITSAFGENVYLGSAENGGFAIAFEKIPVDACIELVSQDWKGANVDVISIYKGAGVQNYVVPPSDPDKVITLCEEAFNDTSSPGGMRFYFDMKEIPYYWVAY